MQQALSLSSRKDRLLLPVALGLVYVVWGSTYLAIRLAVHHMPPFLMAGTRFLVASVLLIAAGRLTRQEWPRPIEMLWAAIVGLFLLVGGNGLVVWSEQYIESGLVALLVATVPLWTLALDSVMPGGTKPNWRGVVGILVGFGGALSLLAPEMSHPRGTSFAGEALVLFGALVWAFGSVLGRRVPMPRAGVFNSGFSMLGAGAVFLVLALVMHERVDLATVPLQAWGAWSYLIVMGSCVGFSAFAWLMTHADPKVTATYAYVNPAVAIALGVLLAGERATPSLFVGAALVLGSVILVVTAQRANG